MMLILASTLINMDELESYRDLLKPAIRIALFAYCIWGLIKLQKWAWWLSLGFSGIYGVMGVFGLALVYMDGKLSALSYEYIAYLSALSVSLVTAAIVLLLPLTRKQMFGRTKNDV